MDKAVKQERYKRLHRNGLWSLAEAMIETLRRKWREEKESKSGKGTSFQDKEIAAKAWDAVYAQLEPLCERLEKLAEKPEPKTFEFVGFTGDPDTLLDPNYAVEDPVQQNVDSYLWLKDEFRRVVIDHEGGTKLAFGKAKRRPPTIEAVQLLEEYARDKPGSSGRKKMFGDVQKALGKLPKQEKSSGIGYAGDR